jgi:hypothetical protein
MVRRRAAERSPGRAARTRSQGVDLGVGPRPVVRDASAVKRRSDEVQLAAPPILLLGTGWIPSQAVY